MVPPLSLIIVTDFSGKFFETIALVAVLEDLVGSLGNNSLHDVL